MQHDATRRSPRPSKINKDGELGHRIDRERREHFPKKLAVRAAKFPSFIGTGGAISQIPIRAVPVHKP